MRPFSAEDYERAAVALRDKSELELAKRFEEAAARMRPVPRAGFSFAGQRLGRLVLWLTVAALVLSALVAIGALVGGNFDDTVGRVLLAVLSVWVFSLAFLGGAGAAASRHEGARLAGLATQVLAVVAMVFSLVVIGVWDDAGEWLIRSYWTAVILSGAVTHAALVLASRRREDSVIRAIAAGTLCVVAALAVLLLSIALSAVDDPGTGYAKTIGVFAVLLALGDLLLPVLARLRRR